MGADLYIESIHDKHKDIYGPLFDAAWMKRDLFARDSALWNEAQVEVDKYYDLLNDSEGYYRDSYNSSNLLWVYGVSYWTMHDQGESDAAEAGIINAEGYMTTDKARLLLEILNSNQEVFDEKINDPKLCEGGETQEEVRAYFIAKSMRFKGFLKRAIELNESIYCSV